MDSQEITEKVRSFERTAKMISDEKSRLMAMKWKLDDEYNKFMDEIRHEGFKPTYSGWKKF